MKDEISEIMIQLVKERKPDNVDQLISFAVERINLPRSKIIASIIQLQKEGRITLKKPATMTPQSLIGYLKSAYARWYWSTLMLAFSAFLAILVIPEDAFPLVFIRYLLGLLLVLYLPGYSLVKTLFLKKTIASQSRENLDAVLTVVLSVGLSVTSVFIVGLLWNYTSWGLSLAPIAASLFALTATAATIALVREHEFKISA